MFSARCSPRRRARSSWTAGTRGSSRRALARVVEPPGLGPLALAGPSDGRRCAARRRAPWRATFLRRAARRRRPRRSRICRAPACSACVFITSVCSREPLSNGLMPCAHAVLVDVDDQLEAELCGALVAERDHLAELPGGVDMQQREGDAARIKRLQRQMQQHRRILADRIEHDRVFAVATTSRMMWIALGFELLQVRKLRSCALLRVMSARPARPSAPTCSPHSFLPLLLPPPAAGALGFAGRDGAGAGGAADGEEALAHAAR